MGGLTDPDFVEEQMSQGRIDFVAMSRQFIADPEWPNKVQQGCTEQLRRCIRCNQECLSGMQQHRGVHSIYDKTGE